MEMAYGIGMGELICRLGSSGFVDNCRWGIERFVLEGVFFLDGGPTRYSTSLRLPSARVGG